VKFPLSKYIWFDGKLVPVNMAKVPVTTMQYIMVRRYLKELEHIGTQKTCMFLD